MRVRIIVLINCLVVTFVIAVAFYKHYKKVGQSFCSLARSFELDDRPGSFLNNVGPVHMRLVANIVNVAFLMQHELHHNLLCIIFRCHDWKDMWYFVHYCIKWSCIISVIGKQDRESSVIFSLPNQCCYFSLQNEMIMSYFITVCIRCCTHLSVVMSVAVAVIIMVCMIHLGPLCL